MSWPLCLLGLLIWLIGRSCGSNHNMVRIEFQCHVRYEDLCNSWWLFQQTGWRKVGIMCEDKLKSVDFGDSVEKINESIRVTVIGVAMKCIPRCKGRGKKKRVIYWKEDCDQGMKARREGQEGGQEVTKSIRFYRIKEN